MRTNIVIDDTLMRDTVRATGLNSKREAVETALRTLLRLSNRGRSAGSAANWPGRVISTRSGVTVDSWGKC